MGYRDIMVNHLQEADSDGNGFLDSLEWLQHLHSDKNKQEEKNNKWDKKVDKQR